MSYRSSSHAARKLNDWIHPSEDARIVNLHTEVNEAVQLAIMVPPFLQYAELSDEVATVISIAELNNTTFIVML